MSSPRKRLPAGERRAQILRSAVKIFSRSNYRAATMAAVAAEAGISEALIYRFFPSKKAIFLEILQHMSDRIVSLWQEEQDPILPSGFTRPMPVLGQPFSVPSSATTTNVP